MPETISAVVVAYNRAALIGTCLRALRFADEVIVVDKSSTDATPEIAARHADRVITVPWTPTVEDTRAFAVAQCAGDWILCLDDDECLSPEAGPWIRAELAAPRADIYRLALRHYILGVHDDEAAYYWPEHHPRLFRRDAVAFAPTVHDGIRLCSSLVLEIPPDSGVAIHHLSHRDVADWIDKCNRYTARPDRQRATHDGADLAAFAHARIDHWLARGKDTRPGGYPAAAAVLRAAYDIVDRLKTWEEERGLNGGAEFARICAALDAAYASQRAAAVRSCAEPPAGGVPAPAAPEVPAPDVPGPEVPASAAPAPAVPAPAVPAPARVAAHGATEAAAWARVTALRHRCDAHAAEAARWSAEATRLAAERMAETERLEQTLKTLQATQQALQHAQEAVRIERQRIASLEASTFWRATAGARRIAEHAKRLARRQ